jgi:hypothetical protein
MHAQHWGDPNGQMNVGAALLRAQLQERVDTRQGGKPLDIEWSAVPVLPGQGWRINRLCSEI